MDTLALTLPITLEDIYTLFPIFLLVSTLFYLSHRETRKSLGESREARSLLTANREELLRELAESNRELHETQVKRMNELTRAAEFGRMAQGLFHDLITPLTSLILHTGKLKDKEKAEQSIHKTIEASERMAKYVKEMRATLSHDESLCSCSLTDELENVLNFLDFKLRDNNIYIQKEIDSDLVITASPTKLRQVFSNLISNSIDAFDGIMRSRKEITISIVKNQLSIKDNGSGIPASHLPHIFEPFYTTKSPDKGTGIGLVTVKNIVEKDLDGRIEVKSMAGEGTEFLITFPVYSRDPDAFPQLR